MDLIELRLEMIEILMRMDVRYLDVDSLVSDLKVLEEYLTAGLEEVRVEEYVEDVKEDESVPMAPVAPEPKGDWTIDTTAAPNPVHTWSSSDTTPVDSTIISVDAFGNITSDTKPVDPDAERK